jgi:hypothetical protein
MTTAYVTRSELMALADEAGAACGKLGREINIMAELYVSLQAQIGALEKRVTELSAPRPKRSRSPRRKPRHVMLAAAE